VKVAKKHMKGERMRIVIDTTPRMSRYAAIISGFSPGLLLWSFDQRLYGAEQRCCSRFIFDQHVLCDNRDKSMISPNIVSCSKITFEQHFPLMGND
jgi:hypothetical protein